MSDWKRVDWISVDDQYPERWQMILIIKIGFAPQVAVFDGKYNHQGFEYWMPLPPPPSK